MYHIFFIHSSVDGHLDPLDLGNEMATELWTFDPKDVRGF